MGNQQEETRPAWAQLPTMPQLQALIKSYENETDPEQKEIKRQFIESIAQTAFEASLPVTKDQLEGLTEGIEQLVKDIESGTIKKRVKAREGKPLLITDEPMYLPEQQR